VKLGKLRKIDLDTASHQEMSAYVKAVGLKLYTRNMTPKRLRETLREFLNEKRKKPTRKQMRKYEVTITREIEHRAVVEVEAESDDVAQQMALNIADNGNPYSNRWVEGDLISQSIKTKVIK
jgi:hypothetical protein